MIYSTDVGSLPFPNSFNEDRFLQGCKLFEQRYFQPNSINEGLVEYFEKTVCNSFVDKMRSGIDIPCYPQYRDMITQFTGFYKTHEGYFTNMAEELLTKGEYNPKYTFIAEVEVLRRSSRRISEITGRDLVEFKACITSPLDLSFIVPTEFLISITKNVSTKSKYLKTRVITLDIPSFGYQMVIDRTLESCREIFDGIKANGKDVETALHLHSGNHRDFLEIGSLDILEIHSELLESPPVLRKELEDYDKFLQVGIASTTNLTKPESISILRKRANKATKLFKDRVKYFSPDCALKGLPDHKQALRLLRNVSKVTQESR
jgi:5-methyltetrahydropteroyltriglutamate--homocysteine methyltransferase